MSSLAPLSFFFIASWLHFFFWWFCLIGISQSEYTASLGDISVVFRSLRTRKSLIMFARYWDGNLLLHYFLFLWCRRHRLEESHCFSLLFIFRGERWAIQRKNMIRPFPFLSLFLCLCHSLLFLYQLPCRDGAFWSTAGQELYIYPAPETKKKKSINTFSCNFKATFSHLAMFPFPSSFSLRAVKLICPNTWFLYLSFSFFWTLERRYYRPSFPFSLETCGIFCS